jgi:hypothetical protein
MFLVYSFLLEHKMGIENNKELVNIFSREGSNKDDILNIFHNEDGWYSEGDDGKVASLCIGYGEPADACERSDHYCAGGKTYGSYVDQAKAVVLAMKTPKKLHPECPLLD